jgi:hypothetical protein
MRAKMMKKLLKVIDLSPEKNYCGKATDKKQISN